MELNLYKRAIEMLGKAILVNPDHTDSYINKLQDNFTFFLEIYYYMMIYVLKMMMEMKWADIYFLFNFLKRLLLDYMWN